MRLLMLEKIFPTIIIIIRLVLQMVFIIQGGSCQKWNLWVNLVEEWSDECGCELAVSRQGFSLAAYHDLTYVDCWKRCIEIALCHYFSFHEINKICTLYDWTSINDKLIDPDEPCGFAQPQPRWFRIKTPTTRTTGSCADVKLSNPSGSSGYHYITIRGILTKVWCQMDTGLTYIDLSAISIWYGSPTVDAQPQMLAQNTFSRAQLAVHKCYIYLNVSDFTFATMNIDSRNPSLSDMFRTSMLLGHAGTASSDLLTQSLVDLSNTDFRFHPHLDIGVSSAFNGWSIAPDIPSKPQLLRYALGGDSITTFLINAGNGIPVYINTQK